MSNEVFLFYVQIIIRPNVTVNRGVNRWELTFEFENFNYAKVSTKKTDKQSKNRNKCFFEVWHLIMMALEQQSATLSIWVW